MSLIPQLDMAALVARYGAKASRWGVYVLAGLLLAAALALAAWWAYSRIYDRGVQAERATWQRAQQRAAQQQAEWELAAAKISDSVADDTRAAATAASTKTTTETEKRQEAIQRVYLADPKAAAPCRPDGGPAPLPAGVFAQLDAARQAAESAAR